MMILQTGQLSKARIYNICLQCKKRKDALEVFLNNVNSWHLVYLRTIEFTQTCKNLKYSYAYGDSNYDYNSCKF